MAREPSSNEILLEDYRPALEAAGSKVWSWVFFSGFLHLAMISALFLLPYLPASKAPYPSYTVDLVGGEKIGGEVLNPGVSSAPQTKTETPAKAEVKPAVKEVKTKKVAEVPVKPQEKVALKESKKEAKKETKAEPGFSEQTRQRLIDSALDKVRSRSQKEKADESASSGPGQGEGAAAPGEGGKGGGIPKGVEFVAYYNRMLSLIRDRWAWVGSRADLEVTVRFNIRDNGEIANLRIVKRSGDLSFDNSVFRAVGGSNPLPPPPESYRKDFSDVEITFRPKDLGG